ncbi:MAG: tol-pal system protein YbgF [Candidatus Polarisedimenticolaceae bacterium]|nr:tol-pal system protein YbgF [Candidatus Polarisedimenticolaceae bacterium]
MKLHIGLAILLLASTSVMAADHPTRYPQATKSLQGPTLEQRIGTLERRLRNQSMADIVLTLQRLQQEVQQLRGEVELQNHTMDALKKQQRDLYLDLDGRISRLQKAPVVSTPVAVVPVEVSPVVPVAATTTPPVVVSTAPLVAADPALEEETYQAAFKLLQQAHYAEAITAFNAFLQRYPSGSYADNAQYWLGEASYVTRDFTQALADFNLLLQYYPDSPKVRGALLKSGYIHYEMQAWQQARRVLEQLVNGYPGSSEARLAETRLQRMSKEGQ